MILFKDIKLNYNELQLQSKPYNFIRNIALILPERSTSFFTKIIKFKNFIKKSKFYHRVHKKSKGN